MALTNDELYQQLLEQYEELTTRHVLGEARSRFYKLGEVLYLLAAYESGRDIIQAKLAYVPEFPSLRYTVFGIQVDHFTEELAQRLIEEVARLNKVAR